MAGLDPAIHVFASVKESKTWITGTSPVMTSGLTEERSCFGVYLLFSLSS